MINQNYNDDKPDFNMAIMFLTRLNERNNDADLNSIEGNNIKVYRALKTIWLSFKSKVKKEGEKTYLEKTYKTYIDDIENMFKEIKADLNNKKTAEHNIGLVDTQIDKVREMIYDLLWDLNMIFPEKIKRTWEEQVEDDFK